MELKESIRNAFHNIGKTEIHINELTEHLQTSVAEYKEVDTEVLKSKISSAISNNLKKTVKGVKKENKDSFFVRVSNGKKGFKSGVYSLRTEKPKKDLINTDQGTPLFPDDGTKKPTTTLPTVSNSIFEGLNRMQIGKVGEFAVVSELLFRGFNANIMTVDDGVDVCASDEKNGSFFYIQVKTTSLDSKNSFSVTINKSSYDRYNSSKMFYVIVLRCLKDGYYQNQFMVFSSGDIEFINHENGVANSPKSFKLQFRQMDGRIYAVKKGGLTQDVTFNHNNWGRIK